MRRCLRLVLVLCALVAMGSSAWAFDVVLAPDQDTFVNSAAADNNDGASPSLYTGHNGMNGAMRALARFAIPAAWQGRVTVTRAILATVTRGTGNDENTPPTPATESLQALTAAWAEGSGFGDSSTMNTVGQACGTSGATWNQPNCAGGAPWAGGSVASTVSGVAAVPATLEATVTWDSATAGNGGMLADVQGWIDSPAGNQGWRIASSTESAAAGQAQRFYSREVAGKGPTLTVTATCRAGFVEADGGCTAAAGDGGVGHDAGPSVKPPNQGSSGCSYAVDRPPLAAAVDRSTPAAGLAAVLIGLAIVVRRRRQRA
ncbi:MAG: DNRLRE domain-containing protein [Verrucomicrobiota bacterium]